MAKLRLYQVDAFTEHVFGGNPAAVVPLHQWLDDRTMQLIASENNLSETAFFIPCDAGFKLRWFTPQVEVRLCGHATLASAFVLFTEIEPGRREVRFETMSGMLSVKSTGDRLEMDFPSSTLKPLNTMPSALLEGLHAMPLELLSNGSDNLVAVFESESVVRALEPDPAPLKTLHPAGVGVTAPGEQSDCVCRYFAPSYGIVEDPGTGSLHSGLIPYWAHRLGKNTIHSRQVSARGSELFCDLRGDRVAIAGRAVKYLDGWIYI